MILHIVVQIRDRLTLRQSAIFNPHLPGRLVHPYQLDESISNFRASGVLFYFYSISNRYSC